jgi:hypothetical protein
MTPMPDLADFDLQKEPASPPPARPTPSRLPLVAGVLAAIALGVGAYVYLRPAGDTAAPPAGVTGTDATVAPATPLGVAVEPIELPPLDQTDTLVRDLVRMLSTHPRVAAWLTTDELIRNFVVVVENIAAGQTPARHLRVLKPAGPFTVLGEPPNVTLDIRSYARYNDIAAAAASVDADGAAKLYSTLKPRIEEAYRELGHAGSFDRVLETALVRLLEVPAVEGDIALLPKGALYTFNDSRLERLTAAQKQLLRMGPRNVRTIQRTLRDTALALGIPAARLPAR